MRVGSNGRSHLGYCTNVFPGESWPDAFAQLKQHLPVLKARLSPEGPFGVGLRLSDVAARELEAPRRLQEFRDWLAGNALYVFTLNGFPYGGFHGSVVKDTVYRPDWSEPGRLDYTLRLARLLASLLPEDLADGSVSTVPLSYKPWFDRSPSELAKIRQACCSQLAALAAELKRLNDNTGKCIHVDLEPEPDCVLEQSEEAVHFFTQWLWPVGSRIVARDLGVSGAEAQDLLRRHIGVCYDTCHFAVGHERPGLAIDRLRSAGVRIGKAQLSAALRVPLPAEETVRLELGRQLRPFAESTYLHQVVGRGLNGLYRYRDLPEALAGLREDRGEEWRIHFHVPIFLDSFGMLHSTQHDIVEALPLLQSTADCRHLEIETYTWDVLPPELTGDLDTLIQREYEWLLGRLAAQQPSHASRRR